MNKNIYMLHADFCKIFTSPVRIELLEHLLKGKKTVSELVELTGQSQPNISQHLHILKNKNIVIPEKKGNKVYYALSTPKISEAFAIIKDILKEQMTETGRLYKKISK